VLRFIASLLLAAGLCPAQKSLLEFPVSNEIPERDVAAKLQQDPKNIPLLLSMGSMKLADAGPLRDEDERAAALDEAQSYYDRVLSLDSQNTQALYNLGVIGWMRVFPALRTARADLAMDPETPGPLRDRDQRAVLNGKFARALNDSIADLQRVLAIDPENNESMAYLNQIYRAKADLEDTVEASKADVATADRWVQKAFETAEQNDAFRRSAVRVQPKAASGAPVNSAFVQAAPPSATPSRVRVGSNVQAANLFHKVDPVYSDEARQARIQGTVRLNAIIAKDGTVANLTVISGHPLLIASAVDAVKRWLYNPTLLNGDRVEVITTIDVNFVLP